LFLTDLKLSDSEIQNLALLEIDKLLQRVGRSLKDFPPMPIPTAVDFNIQDNRFINEELEYDRESLIEEHAKLVANLNSDQHEVYDKVMKSVRSTQGGVFFVYGYGGTGKTFVWRTLSAAVRSNGGIVLNVASSGIASLLLPKGRTGHSRFKVPFNLYEDSSCTIFQGTLAELMVHADLIIWDEAPMMHKHCFEALYKTLRDIMGFKNPDSKNLPFGGKTVVLGGDF
jgi:PIF1-like helicase